MQMDRWQCSSACCNRKHHIARAHSATCEDVDEAHSTDLSTRELSTHDHTRCTPTSEICPVTQVVALGTSRLRETQVLGHSCLGIDHGTGHVGQAQSVKTQPSRITHSRRGTGGSNLWKSKITLACAALPGRLGGTASAVVTSSGLVPFTATRTLVQCMAKVSLGAFVGQGTAKETVERHASSWPVLGHPPATKHLAVTHHARRLGQVQKFF